MKQPSPFFLLRWWNGMGLQNRLLVTFTGLFLYCVLALSVFLYMAVRLVDVNNSARQIFEQNRTIYQLGALVQKYELALNHYEINTSAYALFELNALNSRIDDTVIVLEAGLEGQDAEDLAAFVDAKAQVTEKFNRIVAAVAAEDWDSVMETDDELYEIIGPMYAAVDNITMRGWEKVEALDAEKEQFTNLLYFSLLLGVPLVLLLSGVVALVIHAQINLPLAQLARASKDVLAGRFAPESLAGLTRRSDEVGEMAREFVAAAGLAGQRAAQLRNEADEIKLKIR